MRNQQSPGSLFFLFLLFLLLFRFLFRVLLSLPFCFWVGRDKNDSSKRMRNKKRDQKVMNSNEYCCDRGTLWSNKRSFSRRALRNEYDCNKEYCIRRRGGEKMNWKAVFPTFTSLHMSLSSSSFPFLRPWKLFWIGKKGRREITNLIRWLSLSLFSLFSPFFGSEEKEGFHTLKTERKRGERVRDMICFYLKRGGGGRREVEVLLLLSLSLFPYPFTGQQELPIKLHNGTHFFSNC